MHLWHPRPHLSSLTVVEADWPETRTYLGIYLNLRLCGDQMPCDTDVSFRPSNGAASESSNPGQYVRLESFGKDV